MSEIKERGTLPCPPRAIILTRHCAFTAFKRSSLLHLTGIAHRDTHPGSSMTRSRQALPAKCENEDNVKRPTGRGTRRNR